MTELSDRISEIAKIGTEEGIYARDDSEKAVLLIAEVFGVPDAVFLHEDGNYVVKFLKNGLSVRLKMDGAWRITGSMTSCYKNPKQSNP